MRLNISQELIEEIKYIREVISSSIHYTNLSGIAAIVSGWIALIGCFASYLILGQFLLEFTRLNLCLVKLMYVWGMVFLLCALAHVYFIARKAKKTGQIAWSRLSKLIVYALNPPLLVGIFLTFFFLQEEKIFWIPGIWMISYGLGVWSAGLFSVSEPRYLAIGFMVLGALTLQFFQEQSLWMMALSFGIFQIIYGIRIYCKYGE